MRRKLHVYTGERHDVCERCGMIYPVGEMSVQKGLLLCHDGCFDDLQVESRWRDIEAALGNPHQEGADVRQEYRTNYAGWDYQEG